MLPAPGQMLTPNLRLLSLLGRGGMGSVWLAEHLVLKTEVAVKLLSPELSDDPEALERFRREATAIAQLKSPHVVRIHDIGEAEGTPFFVMERLSGEDLSHRLDRVTRIPLGVVTAIVAQTCKALARVHELGVVHRDLKPGNVFLTDVEGDLVVKLVDFGIAKQRDPSALHATSDTAVLGTPLYMSPEQVLSTKDVTPASDLYSLGVVVYECLAGTQPFSGETLGALHVAIAFGRYTPITVVDPSLPKSLDAWFARALSPTPEHRFASAQEMAETFLAAARGRASFAPFPVAPAATSSAPVALSEHTPREPWALAPLPPTRDGGWLRTMPFVVGGLAVVALVVGVLLGLQSNRKSVQNTRIATTTPEASSEITAADPLAPPAPSADPLPPPAAPPIPTAAATAAASAPPTAAASAPPIPTAAATAPTPPTAAASSLPPKPTGSARPKKDRGF